MTESAILHRTSWRPPTAATAQGIYITLDDGTKLIDAIGGAAVTCIGHGHPIVLQAMRDQLDKLTYVYNVQLSNQPAEDLARYLISTSKGAFALCGFVSGGSEAMEAAAKLARQYFYEIGQPQRNKFIARKLSYHGNTIGMLGLSYHPARRAPYSPILDENSFHHVSPAHAKRYQHENESEQEYVVRLAKELDDKFIELGKDTVIAFVAETVVGVTSGVVPAPKGYFRAMKQICDKYGALFILDEVMCGMGRMGTLHAWESFGDGIAPDLQAVAKGLGGGYASIGAVLMSKKVADGIRGGSGYWQHGHTYQAHPLSCAASLSVQKLIASENLLANCQAMGDHLGNLLRKRLLDPACLAAPYVYDIRGGGLFWGIEFTFPEALDLKFFRPTRFGILVQARALAKGLVIMGMSGGVDGTKGDHIMLAPPYNITTDEVETIATIFVDSIEDVVRSIQ